MRKQYYLFVISALLLTGCNNKTPTDVQFKLAELGNNVEIHTELQLRYINATDYTTTMGIASGSSDKSAPDPVKLSWEAIPFNGRKTNKYEVAITDVNEDKTLKYTCDSTEFPAYNLKINTEYSYTVTAVYPDNFFTSKSSNFKTTAKAPRNLYYENVMNFRDLGGNGIKQGLIYRSARFSEDDGTTAISEETKLKIKKELGIKTEIDLRRGNENGGITTSPLGEDVSYQHLPMYFGGNNILTFNQTVSGVEYNNPARIKEFFDLLANESNYPIDFHCAIGKDRTGCMAYLIKALCGASEEELYRDYLFSNFAKISGMCNISDIDDRYGATIKDHTGDTLQDKTFNYLKDVIGVSEYNLNKIKSILIEE